MDNKNFAHKKLLLLLFIIIQRFIYFILFLSTFFSSHFSILEATAVLGAGDGASLRGPR